MVQDELYFLLSDYPPPKAGDNTIVLAKYHWKHSRITLFNSDAVSTALIHEIGHWLESYIKRHFDFYYHQRLTDQMRSELTHLGLPEYLLTYAQSNPHEFFAVSFEIFF